MEWIGPFLITFLVISALIQLVWAYSMSAMAQKTDQSELMQILAWVPILQIAPTLAVGGASLLHFVMGVIGLVVGNAVLVGVATVLGGGFGRALAGSGLALTALLCVLYFGQIAWRTAVARDRAGWIGLLSFVPIVNFFVYPYLAFHDGWTRPNWLGLAIGIVLAVSSTAPAFQAARMLDGDSEFSAGLATLAALDETALEPSTKTRENPEGFGSDDVPPPDMAAALRALYQLQEDFEALDAVTTPESLLDPVRRAKASDLVQSIRAKLESHRSDLDRKTFEDLAFHLVGIEARIHSGGVATPLVTRTARQTKVFAPVPAAPDPAARETIHRSDAPPIRPYPVQATEGCPVEAELRTQAVEGGEEEWCQQRPEHGRLRHGWYARYGTEGRPESMGEYREGLRVGVWTRFYPTGSVRAQIEFREGLQHGWLLTFDEDGRRTRAVRYAEGVVAP